MENTSPLRSFKKLVPVPLKNDMPPRITSQCYATIASGQEHGEHDEGGSCLVNSGQDVLLLENAPTTTSRRTSASVRASSDDSNDQERYEVERYEMSVSSTPPDTTDKALQSQSHLRDIQEIVIKFWLWEIAAGFLSLVSLASVVGVLIYEDGKQLDQWAWSVPPTAVVSFIGTLSKTCLILVLSQVLSQLKWLHFRDARSLRHLKFFDKASRGPLGAVLVIWSSKRLLASVAACLMILTALVDPFFQLVFTFPSVQVEDGSQPAVFQRLVEWGGITDGLLDTIPPNIWISINQALVSTNTTTPLTSCPSGNCVWPGPIKILGVCGTCSDVTADVKVNCSTMQTENKGYNDWNVWVTTCNYMFSDYTVLQANKWASNVYQEGQLQNIYISRTMWNSTLTGPTPLLTRSAPTLTSTQSASASSVPFSAFNFQQNKTRLILDGRELPIDASNTGNDSSYMGQQTIFSFSAIQLPAVSLDEFALEQESPRKTTTPPAKCWNCTLKWCEKSYTDLQVTGNNLPTYAVSTENLDFVEIDRSGWLYGLYRSEIDNLKSDVWRFRYRISFEADFYFSDFFDSDYVDSFYDGSEHDSESEKPNLASNPAAILGIVLSDDLNATVGRLANSLTEAIRTEPNVTSVKGQTLVSKSFIHVRWAWLALPLALTIMTCVLLPVVAIKSHSDKMAVWKDDPSALLFHRVTNVDVMPKATPADLDYLANKMHVKLDQDTPFTFVRSVGKVETSKSGA